MAVNDIIVPRENAQGLFDERVLTAADISAAAATHASTHHTGGSDALTPANIGAAQAVTVIELTPSPGSTTITTSQLPARGIAFIEGGGSFTVNLPTPDVRQSGLTFSIKVEHEGASGDVFITVVHNASDLLTSYELDEDESSLDFLWDGYRWTYSSSNWLYSFPNRRLSMPVSSGTLGLSEPADNVFRVVGSADATKKVAFEVDTNVPTTSTVALTVPATSGTIARTEDFASPPAIGNTTPASGAFTTLTANNGTVTASAPVISATQTWNDGAVTFTGLAATITNTQSATGSLAARLTVGSTNVFETDVRGFTTLRKVATTEDFVNVFTVRRGTTQLFAVRDDGVVTCSGKNILDCGNTSIRTTGLVFSGLCDLAWAAGGFYILELRGSTNPTTFNIYGTRSSTTSYQRMTVKSVKQTLSALSGASATTTGTFIPDGAVVVGVTTRVSTALTGATGYQVGDGTDADRWGDINAIALNTTSDNRDWTAGTIECFTAGGEVTLTANGPDFTAGAIEICVFYLAGEAD